MLVEKVKLYQKRLAENCNKEFQIFLAVFFSLMLIFTTSKLWLPSDLQIENTNIGTEKNTSASTTLLLRSWQYNVTNQFMEITFDVKNSDSTQGIQFNPIAHTNRNKTAALKTDVAYCNDGLLVIQINDVPNSWDIISLWIKEQSTDIDTGSSSQNEILNSESGANFLCDIREVTKNNSLKSQSKLLYSLKSIDNQIAAEKKSIADCNAQIDKENLEIQQLNFDIQTIKENQKYQTQDEIKSSDSVIQNKTSSIDDLKNSIKSFQQQIIEHQAKVKKLSQKWNDTKSGKFTEPDAESSSVNSKASFTSSASPSSKSSSVSVTVD
ncbi:MAG TPA: hypothetical protein VHP31_09595 [Caproicibacter sp.]|nr:hypothetical protein [Caproicibacter sp.]